MSAPQDTNAKAAFVFSPVRQTAARGTLQSMAGRTMAVRTMGASGMREATQDLGWTGDRMLDRRRRRW